MATQITKEKRLLTMEVLLGELKRAVESQWYLAKEEERHPYTMTLIAPGEAVRAMLSFYSGEAHVAFMIGSEFYRRGFNKWHRVALALRGEIEIRKRLARLVDDMAEWRAGQLGFETELQTREQRMGALVGAIPGGNVTVAAETIAGVPKVAIFQRDGGIQSFDFVRRSDGKIRAELYVTDGQAAAIARLLAEWEEAGEGEVAADATATA